MRVSLLFSTAMVGLSAFLLIAATRADEPATFPFVVSYDAPQNAVNVSNMLDAPAGKHGFVRVKDGKFATDAGEIRFWATNLSGRGNFPDKEHADKLAARLARFGFNCVRLHHMDSWAIWGDKPTSLRKLDPGMLDKLDYLVAAFKKRGIYINMNLHVGRWLDDRDGFPHKNKRPDYDKGLDNFEPRMIELQKEFARDLLTHVNPYTGLSYADDPAVAMVEINNENSVVNEWVGGKLDELPDPYATTFRDAWNDWLRQKYASTDAMLKAWKCVNIPLGEEMIPGGDFTKSFPIDGKLWYFQIDNAQQAEIAVVPDEKLLRMIVHKNGEVEWTPQLLMRRLKIEKDKPYTLSFRIRSDKPQVFYIGLGMDAAPWTGLGLWARLETTPEWKEYSWRFYGKEDYDNARLSISRMKPGTYEVADLTFRPGGNFGLPEDASLEKGTVPTLRRNDQAISEELHRDFWTFLVDLEWRYWPQMGRFLQEELKVKVPISGTQLYYGSKHPQAVLDYCDDHAYWNHPSWPVKRWDNVDWFIRNRALVNFADVDIFTTLGTRRIAGKPHTISEYNHPFPNQYAAEGLPMICAFSRFQGWDGMFQYTYVHEPNIEPEKFTGYFDMIAQTGQLVHAPACAAMLLRGDVATARRQILGALDRETELAALVKERSPRNVDFRAVSLDPRLTLLHATALDLTGSRGTPSEVIPSIPANRKIFTSDTGELTWNMELPGAGYFTLDTPKTKAFTSFIRGREFRIGDITLAVGKTRLDWATVTLTETAPGRWLLAATGFMENSGMKFEKYSDDDTDRRTLHKNWGDAPILCEGIPFVLTMHGQKSVRCFALDTAGNRKAECPVTADAQGVRLTLGPERQTLWYEIELPSR